MLERRVGDNFLSNLMGKLKKVELNAVTFEQQEERQQKPTGEDDIIHTGVTVKIAQGQDGKWGWSVQDPLPESIGSQEYETKELAIESATKWIDENINSLREDKFKSEEDKAAYKAAFEDLVTKYSNGQLKFEELVPKLQDLNHQYVKEVTFKNGYKQLQEQASKEVPEGDRLAYGDVSVGDVVTDVNQEQFLIVDKSDSGLKALDLQASNEELNLTPDEYVRWTVSVDKGGGFEKYADLLKQFGVGVEDESTASFKLGDKVSVDGKSGVVHDIAEEEKLYLIKMDESKEIVKVPFGDSKITELKEQDTYTVLARGISDEIVAKKIATDKKGVVQKDDQNEDKWMVVVKEGSEEEPPKKTDEGKFENGFTVTHKGLGGVVLATDFFKELADAQKHLADIALSAEPDDTFSLEAGESESTEESVEEGKEVPGQRDGTGPYKGSAMAGQQGRRQQAGEECPAKEELKNQILDLRKELAAFRTAGDTDRVQDLQAQIDDLEVKLANTDESQVNEPAAALDSLAKEAGKSKADAERYYGEAKQQRMESVGKSEDQLTDDDYSYIMGVVKKRLGLSTEAVKEDKDEATVQQIMSRYGMTKEDAEDFFAKLQHHGIDPDKFIGASDPKESGQDQVRKALNVLGAQIRKITDTGEGRSELPGLMKKYENLIKQFAGESVDEAMNLGLAKATVSRLSKKKPEELSDKEQELLTQAQEELSKNETFLKEMYDDYGFVLEFNELSEDLQEQKIDEYIEYSYKVGSYESDEDEEGNEEAGPKFKDAEEAKEDEDNRDEARTYIEAHFPMYF